MPNLNIPEPLHEHALVSAETAAATGEASLSTWYALVAAGNAPQPVIRRHRFTRWRLLDVLAYWQRAAEEGVPVDASTGEAATVARARRHRAIRTEKEAARRIDEVQE
jgi:predicted DNA-binding transcriptional regulator AlpA